MKLTIELVPRTCFFTNLRSELTKEEWDMLRKDCYKKAGYKCEICGGVGEQWPVECHERWEYNDEQHVQKLVGLIALCPKCHSVKHIGFAGLRGKAQEAERHLQTINQWTEKQLRDYLRDVWDKWFQRNAFEWTLDLSWLEQYNIKAGAGRAEPETL